MSTEETKVDEVAAAAEAKATSHEMADSGSPDNRGSANSASEGVRMAGKAGPGDEKVRPTTTTMAARPPRSRPRRPSVRTGDSRRKRNRFVRRNGRGHRRGEHRPPRRHQDDLRADHPRGHHGRHGRTRNHHRGAEIRPRRLPDRGVPPLGRQARRDVHRPAHPGRPRKDQAEAVVRSPGSPSASRRTSASETYTWPQTRSSPPVPVNELTLISTRSSAAIRLRQ